MAASLAAAEPPSSKLPKAVDKDLVVSSKNGRVPVCAGRAAERATRMARTKPFTKRPRIHGAPRVDRKAAARRAAHMASPEHRHQATHAFTLRGGRLAAAQIVKIKRTENRPHAMCPGCGSSS